MLFRRLNVVISRIFKFRTLSKSLHSRTMQNGFVMINSVPTHIYTWGQWIEDKFDDRKKEMVLIITGNPGLPGFYTTFATTLYNELGNELPIWVIGQAGHDEPKKELQLQTPPLKGNEHLYNLTGQLDHKADFIKQFVPKDVKIHLIGHSIGSKLCLDLLHDSDFSKKVEHCYLLFPTIEWIADSEKGVKVPNFNRFFFLLRIFYKIFSWLPGDWRRAIVRRQCRRNGMPGDEFLEPSIEYTNPRVIDQIWFLALDEMEKIRQLDEDIIKSNIHRLKLYYGTTDGWVPKSYQQDMIDRFPGIDAELCKHGYEHAFVLTSGPEMGKTVADWINLKRHVKQ